MAMPYRQSRNQSLEEGHNMPLTKCRVIDHSHVVLEDGKDFGIFRGLAHGIYNLKYKINPKTWKLTVVIHNLKGYDSHLIIKALQKEQGNIRAIPNKMEKFTSLLVSSDLSIRYSF